MSIETVPCQLQNPAGEGQCPGEAAFEVAHGPHVFPVCARCYALGLARGEPPGRPYAEAVGINFVPPRGRRVSGWPTFSRNRPHPPELALGGINCGFVDRGDANPTRRCPTPAAEFVIETDGENQFGFYVCSEHGAALRRGATR